MRLRLARKIVGKMEKKLRVRGDTWRKAMGRLPINERLAFWDRIMMFARKSAIEKYGHLLE